MPVPAGHMMACGLSVPNGFVTSGLLADQLPSCAHWLRWELGKANQKLLAFKDYFQDDMKIGERVKILEMIARVDSYARMTHNGTIRDPSSFYWINAIRVFSNAEHLMMKMKGTLVNRKNKAEEKRRGREMRAVQRRGELALRRVAMASRASRARPKAFC